jgi:hypothetical protein
MRHLAAIVLQDSLVTVTAGRRSRGTFLPRSWPGGNDAAKVTRVSRWPVRGVKEPVRYWVDAGRYRVLESCFGALQEVRWDAQARTSQNLIRPATTLPGTPGGEGSVTSEPPETRPPGRSEWLAPKRTAAGRYPHGFCALAGYFDVTTRSAQRQPLVRNRVDALGSVDRGRRSRSRASRRFLSDLFHPVNLKGIGAA